MDLQQFKPQFEKTLDFLRQEISSIRTNRATPALLENIQVEVYGSKMPLIQLASIQAPEANILTVEPWDRQVIKDVEKAIHNASLGLSVANEGTFLRINIPPMTEETRKELLKVLNHKLEQARQAVRGVRDKVKEEIIQAEKNKEISEDDKYKLIEELDEMTREYTGHIQTIGEKKEAEIKP